jgi:succinoglycan biosynthesis protein ExoM
VPAMDCQESAVIEVQVSVLTFRRDDDLRALLPMLLEQLDDAAPLDGSSRFRAEVLVVDNDPAGGAESVVRQLSSARVRYVCEPTPGIAAARNRALDEAPVDGLVVFIDDDERPEPHWLARLLDTWSEHRPAAVGGPVEAVLEGAVDPWIAAGQFFHRAFREGLRTGMSVVVAPTGNILLDMSRINAHGLRFDRSLGLSGGEDTLFTRQLVGSGETIVWCQEAVVLDPVPPSRLTRQWVVRRVFHVSNASISASIRLAPSPRERLRVRARYLATGSGRVAVGGVQSILGTLVRRQRWQALGVARCARGAGAVAAVAGLQFEEYRRDALQ